MGVARLGGGGLGDGGEVGAPVVCLVVAQGMERRELRVADLARVWPWR